MNIDESSSTTVDKFRLIHWLNIRKTTIEVLNNLLSKKINKPISIKDFEDLDMYTAKQIANVLSIPISYILASPAPPSILFSTKENLESTKRPIKRDGIHFYNYYTLPSPKGYVAPVLIDILCPKERLPKLNNGHLESAITLSLGPNDIYARFGKKTNIGLIVGGGPSLRKNNFIPLIKKYKKNFVIISTDGSLYYLLENKKS